MPIGIARAEKKILGAKCTEKVVSAPPGRARVKFLRKFCQSGADSEGGCG